MRRRRDPRLATRRAVLRAATVLLASAAVVRATAEAGGSERSAGQGQGGTTTRRRRRYVDARFGQVHVTTTSPAQACAAVHAPLCCLPFSPRSGRDFDEFAGFLGTDRRVHCPDVPGFGGSDPPPPMPAIEDYAAALLEALDELEPGRRVQLDLFGQHTGAAISIEMAIQRPARIRRLVLVGVPLFSDAEREQLRTEVANPRPYFEDPEFLARAWKRDLAAVDAGLDREAMLLRFTEIMRAGTRSWWGFNAVFNYPMRDRLPRVTQPVLTIALAERLGGASREAARLVVRGRVAEMADLPGSALDFAAARIAAVTREFLDAP
jgi:pimeloyl-ACP methyl ester carboxylesterase